VSENLARSMIYLSWKKISCHYYLSDIILTVRTVKDREIIFALSLTLEKIPGYNRGRGVKNGPKFETFHPD
jgi:hypothetical protein